MSALTVVEAEPRRAPLLAGARPSAIVPQSMEDAYRIATAVCNAGMAPKGLDDPAKALVAIMHGLEVGLTPMAALQRIAVVNGRPTIWGDGAIGLVRGSGACEFIHETLTGADDAMTARCEAKRKGQEKVICGEFSVADAKKAGLWGKTGPWTQYPKRMLQMRARAFALRDGFADVLGGLYLREEIEDETREVRRPPVPVVAASPVIEHKPAVAAAHVEDKREPVAEAATQEPPAPRQRRPPVPPSTPPAQTEAVTGFPLHKARFERALAASADTEAAERAFDAMATSRMRELSQVQYEELKTAFEARLRELEPRVGDMVWEDER